MAGVSQSQWLAKALYRANCHVVDAVSLPCAAHPPAVGPQLRLPHRAAAAAVASKTRRLLLLRHCRCCRRCFAGCWLRFFLCYCASHHLATAAALSPTATAAASCFRRRPCHHHRSNEEVLASLVGAAGGRRQHGGQEGLPKGHQPHTELGVVEGGVSGVHQKVGAKLAAARQAVPAEGGRGRGRGRAGGEG